MAATLSVRHVHCLVPDVLCSGATCPPDLGLDLLEQYLFLDRRWKMKQLLLMTTLAVGGISCWADTIWADAIDPLHGFCSGSLQCVDNGTNSPTTNNPPTGFGLPIQSRSPRLSPETCFLSFSFPIILTLALQQCHSVSLELLQVPRRYSVRHHGLAEPWLPIWGSALHQTTR